METFPEALSLSSDSPLARVFSETVSLRGSPIRSASLNLRPGRSSRSSRRVSTLRSVSSSNKIRVLYIRSGFFSWRGRRESSKGARAMGHTMPSLSWLCSTEAAMVLPTPMP